MIEPRLRALAFAVALSAPVSCAEPTTPARGARTTPTTAPPGLAPAPAPFRLVVDGKPVTFAFGSFSNHDSGRVVLEVSTEAGHTNATDATTVQVALGFGPGDRYYPGITVAVAARVFSPFVAATPGDFGDDAVDPPLVELTMQPFTLAAGARVRAHVRILPHVHAGHRVEGEGDVELDVPRDHVVRAPLTVPDAPPATPIAIAWNEKPEPSVVAHVGQPIVSPSSREEWLVGNAGFAVIELGAPTSACGVAPTGRFIVDVRPSAIGHAQPIAVAIHSRDDLRASVAGYAVLESVAPTIRGAVFAQSFGVDNYENGRGKIVGRFDTVPCR